MDLKTFGDDDFDPKKWINKAWSSSGNQEKEVFLANAVTRLQLYMKQLTNSLDETTTQIVTSIPRVLQDASSLQLEGGLLQQRLLSLERMVKDVEEQTGNSIESLQRIDHLKSRLENAASALREADKWAALATALEDLLEAGVPTQPDKLAELADQVKAMTSSLEVLSDAPDYENKRIQLETLYNRLEAAITPPLIDALTHMDAAKTSSYVSLFAAMSRAASSCRCWVRAAAARAAAAWGRLDTPSLAALTHLLANDATMQVDWLTNVLKCETPLAELIRLYTDLLLCLEPSPTKVVSANLKLCSTPEEGILMLTDLRSDIDELVNCIRAVIDAPRQNKEPLLPATIREFGRAAYAPLRELLPKYTELQSQLLVAHLSDPQLKQEDLLEHSRALLSIAERCDGWIANAYNRAKKIAGIAAYPYYIPAVDNFITSVSNLISSHSRRIETAFLSSVTQGRPAGVLHDSFPASLVLEAATATIIDVLAHTQEKEGDGARDTQHIYDSLFINNSIPSVSNLISSHSRRIETNFLSSVTQGRPAGVLHDSFPASLVLEAATANIIDVLAHTQEKEGDGVSNLISSHSRRIETAFLSSVTQGRPAGVLHDSFPASLVLEAATATIIDVLAHTQEKEGDGVSNLISSHSRRIETAFLSSVTQGRPAGVLHDSFPASLVLEAATATIIDVLAQKEGGDESGEQTDSHPLLDLTTFLLDSEARQRLAALKAEPWGCVAGLRRNKEQLRVLGRAVLRHPVDVQLDKIPQLPVWSNNDALSTDLPDFALSPQEYITEIGQYLMTLPQHLEMHISEKQAPWQFLSEVCTHTCDLYAEKILNIRNMDALGTKRCLTDIVYLSSVVEDLGSNVTPSLKNLEKSLRAAAPSSSE